MGCGKLILNWETMHKASRVILGIAVTGLVLHMADLATAIAGSLPTCMIIARGLDSALIWTCPPADSCAWQCWRAWGLSSW